MEHLDDFKALGNIFDLEDVQIDILKKIYKIKYK